MEPILISFAEIVPSRILSVVTASDCISLFPTEPFANSVLVIESGAMGHPPPQPLHAGSEFQ